MKKETQHGTCKPLDWSLLVLPAYDKRIGATIRLDTRQKWDYEIIPTVARVVYRWVGNSK